MGLKSKKGERVRLTIIGYEFPEVKEDSANWLLVKVEAKVAKGEWEAIDPCLLTYEVELLAQWLDSVRLGDSGKKAIYFTEPNLEFSLCEYPKKGKCLQIRLGYECSPPWLSKLSLRGLRINFPISELDLEKEILSLRQQLSHFPQRTES
jgi:hypothetical protein